jgi:hypothetical protein
MKENPFRQTKRETKQMLFDNVPNLELRGEQFVVPSADHLEKFITRAPGLQGSKPI